ncbi:hypothetical protein OH146_11170 [Salinibacterium sp. SYSU T00001]|uniref:hypothetical protein n=1 Tax=Homoserinimonas sedimenticola TaxID=2986805 RepID=UPI0022356DC2|nr:hypothetical protein [Salinibacterium sedimenticola]MCW4386333.1 hypothetical protein [Salinibacterium sedimenticola]
MSDDEQTREIELISDGDSIAVIGEQAAVDRFLEAEGLQAKDMALHRIRPSSISRVAAVAQVGSAIAASSGRWVKVSKESAQLMKKYELMKGPNGDLARAVLMDKGKIKGLVQIVKGPGSLAASPALLAGAAGIMTQLAMQQSMDEITDYLEKIDKKLDDVIRAQKDAVIADMLGVGMVIDEALTIREEVGRVSEITWSKVQGTSVTIARTQAYALRQLDALAAKLEGETSMGELAETAKEARAKVQEWLAILARCFQLQDAIAVVEIDRVLDAAPEEIDEHRMALKTARKKRLELIQQTTELLLARMDAAAERANTKVLLNPFDSRAIVASSNELAGNVVAFHERLGIGREWEARDAKRWVEAVGDARDDLVEAGAGGVDAAKRFGNATFDRARSVSDKLAIRMAERALRRRDEAETADE